MQKWTISLVLVSFVTIGCSKMTSTFENMNELSIETIESQERVTKDSDQKDSEKYTTNESKEQSNKNNHLENSPPVIDLPPDKWVLPTEQERISYAKELVEKLIKAENMATIDELQHFYKKWLTYDKEFDRTDEMVTPSHVRVRFSNVKLLESTQETFIFQSKIIEVYGEGEDANEMPVGYIVTFVLENNVFMIANIDYQFYY